MTDEQMQAWVRSEIAASEERVGRAILEAGKLFAGKVPGVQAPFGTVIAVTGQTVQVALDVDGVVVASTAVGTVAVGMRVAVLVIPPSGSLTFGPIG